MMALRMWEEIAGLMMWREEMIAQLEKTHGEVERRREKRRKMTMKR